MFAEAVVLPTPPFPDVITITRPLILFTRFAFAVTQFVVGDYLGKNYWGLNLNTLIFPSTIRAVSGPLCWS